MSWFEELGFCATEAHDNAGGDFLAPEDEDEHVGDEIAPGVFLERRKMLWVSLAALGSLVLPRSLRADGPAKKTLTFKQFVDRAFPMAKKLVGSKTPNEEAYLFGIAAMIAQIKDLPKDNVKLGRRKWGMGSLARKFPLVISQIRFKAGGRISHHDHRNYNGVIMGLDGEIAVKNFDILGNPEPAEMKRGKQVQIRQTLDAVITPGRVSTLSRKRDNVHDLIAGAKGGRVLDIFTYFDKTARSHYLTVDEKTPKDRKKKIYVATWR